MKSEKIISKKWQKNGKAVESGKASKEEVLNLLGNKVAKKIVHKTIVMKNGVPHKMKNGVLVALTKVES